MSLPVEVESNIESDLPAVVEPSSLAILARAEADIQISTAHAFPRSIAKFKAEAMNMATLDIETAERCFYAIPRAGKTIEGPSVRLAEIVGSAWGNLRYGSRVVSMGNTHITAQGICHDLQRNVSATVEVQRRVTDKKGRRFNDDMLTVAAAAACSIALRNAIFKVIPFAYVRPIYLQARAVAVGNASTLVNRRADMMAYFQKMGATAERVLAVVGKASVEDIGLDELATLKGVATAIRDGDTTVDQAFPEIRKDGAENGSRTDKLAERLGAKPPENGNKPLEVKAPEEPEPQPPAEPNPEEAAKDAMANDIANQMHAATSLQELGAAGAVMDKNSAALGKARREKLKTLYRQRAAVLPREPATETWTAGG